MSLKFRHFQGSGRTKLGVLHLNPIVDILKSFLGSGHVTGIKQYLNVVRREEDHMHIPSSFSKYNMYKIRGLGKDLTQS